MSYRLKINEPIRSQIDDQVGYYLREGAGEEAVLAWLGGLYDKLELLKDHPRLYPVASWPTKSKGYEVHRLVYSEHVVFYRVHDDTRIVEVLSFRHGRRRPWLEGGSESPN